MKKALSLRSINGITKYHVDQQKSYTCTSSILT